MQCGERNGPQRRENNGLEQSRLALASQSSSFVEDHPHGVDDQKESGVAREFSELAFEQLQKARVGVHILTADVCQVGLM